MSEQDQRDTDLELSGPGGWGAKFRGSNNLLLVLLVVLLVAFGLWYQGSQHELATAKRAADTIARDSVTSQALKNLADAVDNQNKNQEAMIYVLTLDDKQRKALNLGKPDRLREMQR